MNEESIRLSFLASLTGKSRMAAAAFVHMGGWEIPSRSMPA